MISNGTRHESVPAEYLDLDLVAYLVEKEGITAAVDQTGGGVATIKAGPTRPDTDLPDCLLHAALAGPGSYSWDPNSPSVAYRGEIVVGEDNYGEGDYVGWPDENVDEATVAAAIVECVKRVQAAR
jgi:hypothetical protein